MLLAERFLSEVILKYGKNSVSTEDSTYYLQTCRFLKLKHYLYPTFKKSIIERTMQYIQYRAECFDDYFPCRKKKCKLVC